MKAIKFIVVVFLFISVTSAREAVRPLTSQKTLYKGCTTACELTDLDVSASEVKKGAVTNAKEEQGKKQDTQKKRVLKRRKVRRKHKGLVKSNGQGLTRQEYGDEGGNKSQKQHDDSYKKNHQEGEDHKKYGTFDEEKAHKTKNQKQSYFKAYFRDLTKNNNKFYDVYDEDGYNNKGGHSYSSYNDIDIDNEIKKRQKDRDEGAGESSHSDYDKERSSSDNISYDGRRGGDDNYSYEISHGDETSKESEKDHESSDGVLD